MELNQEKSRTTAANAERPAFSPELLKPALEGLDKLQEAYNVARRANAETSRGELFRMIASTVDAVPEMFAEERAYIKAYCDAFQMREERILGALEARVGELQAELEQKKSSITAIDVALTHEKKRIEVLVQKLSAEIEALKKEYKQALERLEKINSGALPFREKLSMIGRKARELAKIREVGNKAHELKQLKIRERSSLRGEQSRLEAEAGDKQWHIRNEEGGAQRELREHNEKLERAQRKFFKELLHILGCVERDLLELEKGGNLHLVDTIRVDTRARAEAAGAFAEAQNLTHQRHFERLSVLGAESDPVILAKEKSRMNGSTLEQLRPEAKDGEPFWFYTNQVVDSSVDTVSRRFERCVLVEAFSPRSRRHISFHLAPVTINLLGQSGGSFIGYKPKFFHDSLSSFIAEENCAFNELEIKVVSGLAVPPDQVRAALVSIGCAEEKIKLVQLPVVGFTTLTVAAEKLIFVEGERTVLHEFGEPITDGQDRFVVSTGSGHGLHSASRTGEIERYVV